MDRPGSGASTSTRNTTGPRLVITRAPGRASRRGARRYDWPPVVLSSQPRRGWTGVAALRTGSTTAAASTASSRAKSVESPTMASPIRTLVRLHLAGDLVADRELDDFASHRLARHLPPRTHGDDRLGAQAEAQMIRRARVQVSEGLAGLSQRSTAFPDRRRTVHTVRSTRNGGVGRTSNVILLNPETPPS